MQLDKQVNISIHRLSIDIPPREWRNEDGELEEQEVHGVTVPSQERMEQENTLTSIFQY